ncbi:Protein of unknown function [Lactobacillus helveticus CIRM-BIA 103]|nr:Protein of unknown function [Lactobacillus helveticus CIRM-BIA 103]
MIASDKVAVTAAI